MNTDAPSPWGQFNGKSILVTGGTGSFGRAFIRRLMENCKPSRVVVLSRDELKQTEMASEFQSFKNSRIIRFYR